LRDAHFARERVWPAGRFANGGSRGDREGGLPTARARPILRAVMRAPLAISILLIGCAHAPPPEPGEALAAYASALERNDARAAYALLAPPVRAHTSEADFAARWRSSTEERRAQAAELRASLRGPRAIDEWAAVVFPDGGRVPLARDDDGWRLTSTALGEAHAATPVEALRQLAQALEARRFDLVVNLLGEPLRSEVERQLRERLEQLRAALDQGRELEVVGDRARLQYGPGFRIDLHRQGGEWRIHDLN